MEKLKRPRRDVIPKDAKAHTMPPLLGFDYLAAAWSECGACGFGMNGPVPLDWQEIHAYNCASRRGLGGYECRLLSMMSRAYCAEFSKAGKAEAVQPYVVQSHP